MTVQCTEEEIETCYCMLDNATTQSKEITNVVGDLNDNVRKMRND